MNENDVSFIIPESTIQITLNFLDKSLDAVLRTKPTEVVNLINIIKLTSVEIKVPEQKGGKENA